MTTVAMNSPAPRKRNPWLRRVMWLLGMVLLLLVLVYFIGTSSAFFKGVILPRVSKAVHADITVSEASISPFKQVILRNLKVQTTGTEPLATASEARVQYSLMDILAGKINLHEVQLTSPSLVLVENPDKTTNLDPILKSQSEKTQEKKTGAPEPGKASKPIQLDLQKLILADATVRKIKQYAGGNRDVVELSHVNVTATGIKNGQAGKAELTGEVSVDNHPPAPSTNGLLQAKLSGAFDFTLNGELKPTSVKGTAHVQATRAEGALAQLANVVSDLDCDVTPTDLKQVAIRVQRGTTRLGELRVSGPFDPAKTEGKLDVQLSSIDKELLNVLGTKQGIDFGTTTLNTSNRVELANGGAVVSVAGQLALAKLQLTRTNQTTPPLDLVAEYDLKIDNSHSNVLIRALSVKGTQRQNPLVRGELTSPMTLAWGGNATAVGDSSFNLSVTRLDLSDWKPFAGPLAPSGLATLELKLLSQQSGKQLTFDTTCRLENLNAALGTNQINQADITLQANGQATDLKRFNLSAYKLQIARKSQPVIAVSGSGTYDHPNQDADLQLVVQATLPRLLEIMPQPDVSITSGSFDLKGHLTQKQKVQAITGNASLSNLNARFGKNELQNFGTAFNLDLGLLPGKVEIRKATGETMQSGKPGGSFDVSGTYDLTNKATRLNARLVDWNANGLRPFLEPLLTDKKLVSIALNANALVQQDPQGNSSIKGELQVTNLVVNDPKGSIPSVPLAGKLELDAAVDKQVATLRQVQLSLTPTARAANQVQLTGQLDMSQTNATQGHLKLVSESLDATSYYDLFSAPQKQAENRANERPVQNKPTAPSSGPEQEPAPIKLPFRNFTAEANVGRFYLREVQISNFVATTKIDGGHVVLKPFQLVLNGASVNATADLDLGIAGYNYDTTLSAQSVPLAPLVNSFQPDFKGKIGGTCTANAKINGLGITGAGLQKNLKGQFDVSSTNLNLSVVNIKYPLLRNLLNLIANLPDLLRDPSANLGNLVQGLLGGSGNQGGLAAELEKSPVNSIFARGDAGSGKINLQQASVQSAAFQADANGTITLAPVLTNSALQIPVSLSLSRGIAERLNVLPEGTPTNAAYAKLPDFLTMKGTLGRPDPIPNKLVLAGIAAKTIGGIAGTNKVGQVVQSLGGLLTGRTDTNSVGTNRQRTDANAILQGLGGLLGGATSQTNRAATNQSPVNDLLNDLLAPKKK